MNFNQPYNREDFKDFAADFLPDDLVLEGEEVSTGLSFKYTENIRELGNVSSLEDLAVLEITHGSEHDPRVSVTREAFKVLKRRGDKHALAAFRSDKSDNYRISYIKMWPKIEEGELKKEKSNPRRYSFYLGPDAQVNTPHEFLKDKGKVSSVEDLESRFDVEVVNKEFYKKIAQLFSDLVNNKDSEYSLELPGQKSDGKAAEQFTIRLIGRIIFCWFLREKESEEEKPLIPEKLLSKNALIDQNDYYHKVLEPLFFEVLNRRHEDRKEEFQKEPFDLVPYLNGGLFTPQDDDYYSYQEDQAINNNTLNVPDDWLENLFEVLELYNFTIDENTSFDVDLSIDPEMLGRIFENLLAEKINPETKEDARNSTGSFYTPREIVDYMVDESLIEHLKTKTEMSEEKIRALVSYDLTDDEDYPLTGSEASTVVDVLSEVTILDPACGSGAFPIGVLQKIVFILQQVDPDAKLWFEQQIENVPPETKAKIKREFEEQNHDYIRKSAVIRESIYGVDIQPVATEIARLRCFLTLIVDERIEEERANRGIEPLPNLEFKFVTANTLKRLPKEESGQGDLFGDQTGMDKLARLRDEYFAASNAHREKLKKKISDVQEDMWQHLIEIGAKSDRTMALSGWSPFTNEKTEWFDPKWMFGVNKFDIVIGNPPYKSSERIDEPKKSTYKETYSKVHKSRTDIYAYFYQRGVELSKENTGLLCYITSNKWMRAGYGEGLRAYFANKNPLQLVNFGGVKVFDSATVDTAILLIENARNKNKLEACEIENDYTKASDLKHYVQNNSFPLRNTSPDTWFIAPPEVVDLKEKIEKVGTALKDWDVEINYGIKTGYNEAFIIDKAKRDELIAKDPKSEEIIKPMLRGSNIDRYSYDFDEEYIIITKFGSYKILEEEYPVVYEHLKTHEESLKDRAQVKKTRSGKSKSDDYPGQHHWLELDNNPKQEYIDKFEEEKVVWQRITQEPAFCVADAGDYTLDSMAFISAPNQSDLLSAVLNSSVVRFYFDQVVHRYGSSGYRLSNQYVAAVPIPKPGQKLKQEIDRSVEKILNKKQAGKDTADLENEINELVMDLYELTDEEREVIRNS